MTLLAAIGWYALGVAGSGFSYAALQKGDPTLAEGQRLGQAVFSYLVAIGGPYSLVAALAFAFARGFHGWMLPGSRP